MSLPEHRYRLAGGLLAAAIEDAETSGEHPRTALERRARLLGNELAASAPSPTRAEADADAVMRILEEQGFEPRVEGNAIVPGNCPFHTLAQDHTALVCQMNLCLLDGLLEGLNAKQLRAELKPGSGHCCVRIEPASE